MAINTSPQSFEFHQRSLDTRGWGRAPTLDGVRDGASVLQRGMGGQSVAELQRQLSVLGYMPAERADGRFGAETDRAVRAFQRANNLTEDGMVGRQTREALFGQQPARAAVDPVTGYPTSDAEANRARSGLEAVANRPRPSAATELTQAPWAQSGAPRYAQSTIQRAERGVQTLERVEGEVGALPEGRQAEARQLIGQLRDLYRNFAGAYLTTGRREADVSAASRLEARLQAVMTRPR